MIVQVVAAVFVGVALWCLGGAIVTLTVAWVNARVSGAQWFHPEMSMRWTKGDDLPPPIAVFLLWPLAIPVALIGFVGLAFFRMTEKVGTKLIALGERQAKAARP